MDDAAREYGRLRHREEQHYGERRADRSKRKDGHSGWTDFCATTELEKYSEWLRLYGGRYGYHLGRGGENGNGAASG